MRELIRKNKGITLIALIITIIVLLILAGVTIAQITGNENAMDKAVEAKEKLNKSAAKDELQLNVIGTTAEKELQHTKQDIIDGLEEIGAVCTANGELYNISYKGYNFILNKKNEILDDEGQLDILEFEKISGRGEYSGDIDNGEIIVNEASYNIYMPGGEYKIHKSGYYIRKIIDDEVTDISDEDYIINEKCILFVGAGSTVTIKDKDNNPVKLKLINNIQTITLDPNGGTFVNQDSNIKRTKTWSPTNGSSFNTYDLPIEGITKDGYRLLGWNTTKNATTGYTKMAFNVSSFQQESNVLYLSGYEDYTLYAIWIDENALVSSATGSAGISYDNEKEKYRIGIGSGSLSIIFDEPGYTVELSSHSGTAMTVKFDDTTIETLSAGGHPNYSYTYEVESSGSFSVSMSGGQVYVKVTKDGNDIVIY